MDRFAQTLLLPAAILILLGALFIIVQMTAAVRVGEGEAMRRLKKWRKLPEAILRLATAPTPRAALSGMTVSLAEAVRAEGAMALLRQTGRGAVPGKLDVAASLGTLQGQSDRQVLEAVLAVPEIAGVGMAEKGEKLVEIPIRRVPSGLRRIFPRLKSGRLVVLPLKLDDAGPVHTPSALILLHIAGRRRLDRVDLEAIESAMSQLPRLVTGVTSRLAQAEVLEQLLEEARVKDGLLRMLLGSFQHDLGNTLASLQVGVARAWEVKEAQASPDDTNDAEFAELYRTIQLAATVARSGEGMVDIAEGKSPIAVVEPYSPLEVFDQVVRPFVTLRARRRPELDVRIEIPDDLPLIYVDRVRLLPGPVERPAQRVQVHAGGRNHRTRR